MMNHHLDPDSPRVPADDGLFLPHGFRDGQAEALPDQFLKHHFRLAREE
jgi:hypothetical protein